MIGSRMRSHTRAHLSWRKATHHALELGTIAPRRFSRGLRPRLRRRVHGFALRDLLEVASFFISTRRERLSLRALLRGGVGFGATTTCRNVTVDGPAAAPCSARTPPESPSASPPRDFRSVSNALLEGASIELLVQSRRYSSVSEARSQLLTVGFVRLELSTQHA